MEEWAIKIVYMWNEKIREGSLMYIQKHLLKVCVCIFNTPWVAHFLHFFSLSKLLSTVNFHSKGSKIKKQRYGDRALEKYKVIKKHSSN